MLFYNDPWKDNPYGRLKPKSLADVYAVLAFDEGKLYKQEDDYVLCANFTQLNGVVRSFKPENPIQFPAIATWEIHSKDYSDRQKNDETGKYETVSCKPSISEKLIHQAITSNPQWLEKGIKGSILHYPDANYRNHPDPKLDPNSLVIEVIELSGTLPEWTPPKPYSKNGSGSWSKGASLEEKETWLKRELTDAILNDFLKEKFTKESPSIHTLIHEVVQQHKDNEMFLGAYIDLLKGVLG